ncbi:MAG: hypothetical protein JWN38_772 [Candidatus Saccharibacteria bacterium]|nr:hypothetical protein [Candidatus Saccharibacteria bacterium]
MTLLEQFPELNPGQIQMLTRYIQEREQQAIQNYKQSRRNTAQK